MKERGSTWGKEAEGKRGRWISVLCHSSHLVHLTLWIILHSQCRVLERDGMKNGTCLLPFAGDIGIIAWGGDSDIPEKVLL